MYGIALGVAVVSLAATFCSIEPAYRHTFVGSMTGKQFWREYWLTDVLHESYQTVDEQRKDIMSSVSPLYTPLDLAVPWILEKAAEVEQAQSNAEADIEANFVVPRWLTRKHCDRQMVNIEYWKGTGGISEAEAEQLRSAVGTLRGAIRDDMTSSRSKSFSSRSSRRSASLSAPPTQAAERNSNQLPSLQGAKIGPIDTDSEEKAERTPDQPPPPIGSVATAPPAGRQAPERALSRAESLGVPASTINRRRSTATAAGAGLAPMVLALELAVVMRESTRTEEAVEEWWDVNMAPLADADSERTLLVALMEELRPALLLAKVFVWV